MSKKLRKIPFEVQMMMKKSEFWEILFFLQTNKTVHMNNLCYEFGVSEDFVNEVIHFLSLHHIHSQITENGENKILELVYEPTVDVKVPVINWIALQTSLNDQDIDLPVVAIEAINEQLKDEILRLEDFDIEKIYQREEAKRMELGGVNANKYLLDKIEEAIDNEISLNIKKTDASTIDVYPHKLVYLQDDLNLICENINERTLMAVPIDRIYGITFSLEIDYTKNFADVQIEDFISAVRGVDESEIRLVLKLYDLSLNLLNPKYIYLKDPCVVENIKGERIWAATLDNSQSMLDWLDTIIDKVEIVEPYYVEEELLRYRKQLKKKKAA